MMQQNPRAAMTSPPLAPSVHLQNQAQGHDPWDTNGNLPALPRCFRPMPLHPKVGEADSMICFGERGMTVKELLYMIPHATNEIMTALGEIKSKGKTLDAILTEHIPTVDFLKEVAFQFCKPSISFPVLSGPTNRRSDRQLCSHCGDTPGDWDGMHHDGSDCMHSNRCGLCHTLGLGAKRDGSDDANIHDAAKCPFAHGNVPLFVEFCKRRFDFKLKDLKKGASAYQQPAQDDDLTNSFLSSLG
jgi:hypothetical protein